MVDRALEEYPERSAGEALAAEARRQSLLATSVITKDEEFWSQTGDTSGWK